MYLPARFKNENEAEVLEIIAQYPLATLISTTEEAPFISHLPLVVESTPEGTCLLGHLAKANSHWKLLKGSKVTAIFHGPNAYITPKWYEENDVPTWNYAVVHVRGHIELIEDHDGIVECLKKLTAHAEAGVADPWAFWIPGDRTELTSAILGFRIVVERLEAKFKLSQNRSEEDQRRVIQGLNSREDQMSRDVSKLMTKKFSLD